MKAMRLHRPGDPLLFEEVETPAPRDGEVLVRVEACGVCRTDLHIVDGELPPHVLPLIPGHEIVGHVERIGPGVTGMAVGARVGIPWLGHTCGHCDYCTAGRENLCDYPGFTGYDIDGGYAEYAVAAAEACIPLPKDADAAHLAPLLCAGLIGYRSYRFAQPAKSLGLFGFGAAAHILTQLAVQDGIDVYAITRPGDEAAQRLALSLGVKWTGSLADGIPSDLDSVIIFAPDGTLVPAGLRSIRKGGRVVCAGIHMSDIPAFPYSLIWGERQVLSVANLTRQDGIDFFQRAATTPIETTVTSYPLKGANTALADLRSGALVGAAVLVGA
ncbi:MAG TPA: zinc-dependent alcohol dehydrogenase family protein [Devosia sp.]